MRLLFVCHPDAHACQNTRVPIVPCSHSSTVVWQLQGYYLGPVYRNRNQSIPMVLPHVRIVRHEGRLFVRNAIVVGGGIIVSVQAFPSGHVPQAPLSKIISQRPRPRRETATSVLVQDVSGTEDTHDADQDCPPAVQLHVVDEHVLQCIYQ